MQKSLIVLFVMLFAFNVKSEEMVWILTTDSGKEVSIADVDYLLSGDSNKVFSVVLKNGETVDAVKKVTFRQVSGIGKIVADNGLNLFPNPVESVLNISGCRPGANVDILTIDGKIVLSADVSQQESLTIDVSGLAPGYYLLATEHSTIKFIKK